MSKPKTRQLPIRLALREEGDRWNAYLAKQGTMEGALLIGSIMIGPVRGNNDIKQRFQKLMQDVMTLAIEEITGKAPDHMDVQPAPESERSGNA